PTIAGHFPGPKHASILSPLTLRASPAPSSAAPPLTDLIARPHGRSSIAADALLHPVGVRPQRRDRVLENKVCAWEPHKHRPPCLYGTCSHVILAPNL